MAAGPSPMLHTGSSQLHDREPDIVPLRCAEAPAPAPAPAPGALCVVPVEAVFLVGVSLVGVFLPSSGRPPSWPAEAVRERRRRRFRRGAAWPGAPRPTARTAGPRPRPASAPLIPRAVPYRLLRLEDLREGVVAGVFELGALKVVAGHGVHERQRALDLVLGQDYRRRQQLGRSRISSDQRIACSTIAVALTDSSLTKERRQCLQKPGCPAGPSSQPPLAPRPLPGHSPPPLPPGPPSAPGTPARSAPCLSLTADGNAEVSGPAETSSRATRLQLGHRPGAHPDLIRHGNAREIRPSEPARHPRERGTPHRGRRVSPSGSARGRTSAAAGDWPNEAKPGRCWWSKVVWCRRDVGDSAARRSTAAIFKSLRSIRSTDLQVIHRPAPHSDDQLPRYAM
jgi:hypothetical protein